MNGLTGTVARLYNTFEPDIRISIAKGKNFHASDSMINRIKEIDGVKLVSRTLQDKALIKNVDKQLLISVKGVDRNFVKMARVDTVLTDGNYLLGQDTANRIVMGEGVAARLQVNIHELVNTLALFSPAKGEVNMTNPEDNMTQVYVSPCATFSLTDEVDYQWVFVNLSTAQQLFDEPGKVSGLEIMCEPGKNKAVQEKLDAMLGKKFVIKNRYQLNDILFKTLETEKLAVFIILAFILVIATFNIIGALTMLIIEKSKDIKTLFSMGANIGMIRNIFMGEGFLITSIGTVAGLILGFIVCWVQIKFHVIKYADGVIPFFPVEMQLNDFIGILCLIMVIGFFAALYPVRIFTKMDLVHKSAN
jgi:ABC-type lipoprotein release transport system permease subunit